MKMASFLTFWIQLRKNKPLDESHKNGQTSGTKMAFYSIKKLVVDLARLNHESTWKLLGFCIDTSPFQRMLVFEYASDGTLYENLHYEEGCHLSCSRRMNIMIGVAKGLRYLHTEIKPPFTISKLNSSAVLDDFESWKTIVTRSESSAHSISHEGDMCVLPSSFEERDLDICVHKEIERTFKAPRPYIHERIVCHFGK
ncbi:putative protein kinase RLK-Pelle-LRR-VI-2 family [Helianthus anomalus]